MHLINFNDLLSLEGLLAVVAIIAMELALGFDNLLLLSILSDKLPAKQQPLARKTGLILAMAGRLIFVAFAGWLVGLSNPLFTITGKSFSAKDLVFILGGAFLIYKATHEIFQNTEPTAESDEHKLKRQRFSGLAGVLIQVILMDFVFSIDSVLTAVGMTKSVAIMMTGVVGSVIILLFAVNYIAKVLKNFPSLKVLALSFLLVIGVVLITEGWDHERSIPKAYIYVAMGFALLVELLNIYKGHRSPVKSHSKK